MSDTEQRAPTTGQETPIVALKDQFGDERDMQLDKYPDGSPAKDGTTTLPSGQGGASPKSRPDYQDMFARNPEPSESAKQKGEENDAIAKGERTIHDPTPTEEVAAAAEADQAQLEADTSTAPPPGYEEPTVTEEPAP